MSEQPPTKSNGNPVGGLIQLATASGDKWVQLATIALVVLSGGGNFFTTNQNARQLSDQAQRERADILKAVEEIHDVHGVLNSTLDRQKEMHENVQRILEKLNQQKPP